jgi:hypothetical protein
MLAHIFLQFHKTPLCLLLNCCMLTIYALPLKFTLLTKNIKIKLFVFNIFLTYLVFDCKDKLDIHDCSGIYRIFSFLSVIYIIYFNRQFFNVINVKYQIVRLNHFRNISSNNFVLCSSNVEKGKMFEYMFELTPVKAGKKDIIVVFNSTQIEGVDGLYSVTVTK